MMIARLFWIFLTIGMCSFGGGYAVIPLIQEQLVHQYHWINNATFLDMITISQLTPGPLAVNISTFVGLQLGGILGAIVSTLGCISFGVLISLCLYRFFQAHQHSPMISYILEALKSASSGLILSAAISILLSAILCKSANGTYIDWFSLCLCLLMFYFLRRKHWNPTLIFIISGISGILFYGDFF